MSDSRFSLKGEFRIYGQSFPIDMSLNWNSQDEWLIDPRITEFFFMAHDSAYARWRDHALATEEEKATLRRLRAKYPNE